jgi:hypothetical protein
MSAMERIIAGLQTALVASILVNAFMAACLAVVVRELHREMAHNAPKEKVPATLATPTKRIPWLQGPAAIAAALRGGEHD